MTQPALLAVLAVLGVLALVLVAAALVVTLRSARRLEAARTEVETVRREAADLRSRLDRVEAARAGSPDDAGPWVITDVGALPVADRTPAPAPAPIDGRLFADTVLRETVVKAAGLGHGLRRALAPEVRGQIRREMRREVRRSRRQRRSDHKAALRAWQAAERERRAA